MIDQNNLPLKSCLKKAASLLLAHLVAIKVHGKSFAGHYCRQTFGEQRVKIGQWFRVKAETLVRILGLQVIEFSRSLFK